MCCLSIRVYNKLINKLITSSVINILYSEFKILAKQRTEKPPEECLDMIRTCLAKALLDLKKMQEREGNAMLDNIKHRLSSCAKIMATIENMSRDEPDQFKKRLEQPHLRLS